MNLKNIPPLPIPLGIAVTAMLSLATFFYGWSGKLLQQADVSKIPPTLLLLGLLISLGTIALLVVLVVLLWHENTKIKLTPTWYPRFSAQWKYHPGKKRFHPWPYCACCPSAPKSLGFLGMNQEFKVEHLRCPLGKTDWFILCDTSSGKEEYLTVKQALDRITKEVANGI